MLFRSDLQRRTLELIDGQARRATEGRPARIFAKLNSLVDHRIIESLYRASQAGVPIDIIARGICCLRPGVPGLSENITVTSVIDRFLEHARILYFYHGGDERLFISSADWMPRNLDRRVELLVPVEDPAARVRLMTILKTCFQDNVKARRLLPDGRYEPVKPTSNGKIIRSQEELYRRAVEEIKEAERARLSMFEPHRRPGSDE